MSITSKKKLSGNPYLTIKYLIILQPNKLVGTAIDAPVSEKGKVKPKIFGMQKRTKDNPKSLRFGGSTGQITEFYCFATF